MSDNVEAVIYGNSVSEVAGRCGAVVVARLQRGVADGTIVPCSHLADGGMAVWTAWSPTLLRCAQCATDARMFIADSDADYRCDCCRRIDKRVRPCAVLLPTIRAVAAFALCPMCANPGAKNHRQNPGKTQPKNRGRKSGG